MADYITPSDLSALNSAVMSSESYSAAKRGAEGILERISASRDAAGIADHEIFNAISRGASNKSGLHWLAKLMGTLTEYLGSWGTLVLVSVSFLAALELLRENATGIWNAITGFVKDHPMITGVIGGAALGTGASMLMRSTESDVATDALKSIVMSTLPLPIAIAVGAFGTRIASEGKMNQALRPAGAAASVPSSQSAMSNLVGDRMDMRDAYVRDAYVRDAMERKPAALRVRPDKGYSLRDDDTMSGNLGT